jgi:hypothetical protein
MTRPATRSRTRLATRFLNRPAKSFLTRLVNRFPATSVLRLQPGPASLPSERLPPVWRMNRG